MNCSYSYVCFFSLCDDFTKITTKMKFKAPTLCFTAKLAVVWLLNPALSENGQITPWLQHSHLWFSTGKIRHGRMKKYDDSIPRWLAKPGEGILGAVLKEIWANALRCLVPRDPKKSIRISRADQPRVRVVDSGDSACQIEAGSTHSGRQITSQIDHPGSLQLHCVKHNKGVYLYR